MSNDKSRLTSISRRRRLIGGFLFTTGYILSPASWWNDAVVNIPLAYIVAWLFSRISGKLFLPAMIIAYWATNILGFLMMHIGGTYILRGNKPKRPGRLMKIFIISTIYTILMIVLVKIGLLRSPI
jgi:hypothetical protein